MPQTPNTTYFSPANAAISKSYDIEFGKTDLKEHNFRDHLLIDLLVEM